MPRCHCSKLLEMGKRPGGKAGRKGKKPLKKCIDYYARARKVFFSPQLDTLFENSTQKVSSSRTFHNTLIKLKILITIYSSNSFEILGCIYSASSIAIFKHSAM